MSQWNTILDRAEIAAYHARTATLDARFAAEQRKFYETRTLAQLESLAHQAWLCCEPSPYQLARSYAAAL